MTKLTDKVINMNCLKQYNSEVLTIQQIDYVNQRLAEEFIDRLGYEQSKDNVNYMIALIQQFERTQKTL